MFGVVRGMGSRVAVGLGFDGVSGRACLRFVRLPVCLRLCVQLCLRLCARSCRLEAVGACACTVFDSLLIFRSPGCFFGVFYLVVVWVVLSWCLLCFWVPMCVLVPWLGRLCRDSGWVFGRIGYGPVGFVAVFAPLPCPFPARLCCIYCCCGYVVGFVGTFLVFLGVFRLCGALVGSVVVHIKHCNLLPF